MIFKKSFLVLILLFFVACGGDITTTQTPTQTQIPSQGALSESEENIDDSVVPSNPLSVRVSGAITYDFVPFKSGSSSGLDYNNISKKPVRGAVVELLDEEGKVLGTTSTDASGFYAVNITGTKAKVRVYAKLYKEPENNKASWNFQVKDNTNANALYVMEGSLAGLGETAQQTRNLNASSGWDGNAYSSRRVAAPFAILDVVYQAVQKVTTAQSDAVFAPLDIFWSKYNVAANGDKNRGQIITSHYDGVALYILGAEDSDTDEYDSAIIAHEWGHYYESIFSRSDSIGGSHGSEDMLDIRVAFGEGFGTAMGCMIIDSPLYQDSSDRRQGSTGIFANLENGGFYRNAGWYNEQSIYSIIYDIYDSEDDRGDTISLGFTPIHEVFVNAQKNTPAFTSIFTFITALKAQNPELTTQIDALTSNEDIAPINDIYGTGRINRRVQNANPLYSNLTLGGSVNILTNYTATATSPDNRLGAYNFVKFDIPASGIYTFSIYQVGGSGRPDPDFMIYKGDSIDPVAVAQDDGISDSLRTTLSAGTYRMAVVVYNQSSGNTFNLTLNQ